MSAAFPLLPTLDIDVEAVIALAESGNGRANGKKSKSNEKKNKQPRQAVAAKRVAIFGQARELTLYRAEVLRLRGFSVIVAGDRRVAEELIRRHHFDIAVFSYTLPSDLVQDLADLLREHRPECPLIAIAQQRWKDSRVKPDAVVLADDGPEALIKALRKVSRPN